MKLTIGYSSHVSEIPKTQRLQMLNFHFQMQNILLYKEYGYQIYYYAKTIIIGCDKIFEHTRFLKLSNS